MVRRIPEATRFGGMRRDRERTDRRIDDLERVDGAQYGRILQRVRLIRDEIVQLTTGLAQQVQDYIGIYSRTRAEIDSKNSSQDTAIAAANSNANSREPAIGTLPASKGGTATKNAFSNTFTTGEYRIVYVQSNGQLGHAPSAFRLKQDVQPARIPTQAFLDLPVQVFRYRDDAENGSMQPQYGFIAEDLADLGLEPWLYRDDNGVLQGVAYEKLPLAHHELLREQHQQIMALQAQVAALSARLDSLEKEQ